MDNEKLIGFIKDSSFNIEELSIILDLKRSTMYYQIRNNIINSKDLSSLFDTINLSDEQILALFGR